MSDSSGEKRGEHDRNDKTQPPQALPVTRPEAVPVFNCVVYVSRADGRVRARSAHLADLSADSASERDALRAVATAFKQRAAEAHARGESLDLDEPLPKEAGESERLIPVHL